MVLAEKYDRTDIDLYDKNYMLLFDIDDQKYIQSTFVKKVQAYTQTINGMNQTRAKLRNRLKVLHAMNVKENLDHSIEVGIRLAVFKEQLQSFDQQLYNMRKEQNEILKKFYDLTDRAYNDQTKPEQFNPIEITFKNDVFIAPGIDTIGAQITNTSSVIWEYVDIGRSPRPATIGDQELDDSIGRFPIDEGGSFSSIGDQVRLFCVLPDQIDDEDIYEFSINELASGGKTLSRTAFKKPIKHKKTKTFPTITNVTYLIPHIEEDE